MLRRGEVGGAPHVFRSRTWWASGKWTGIRQALSETEIATYTAASSRFVERSLACNKASMWTRLVRGP